MSFIHRKKLNLDTSRFVNTFIKILMSEHFQIVPFLDTSSTDALPAQFSIEENHSKIYIIYKQNNLQNLFIFINSIPLKLLNIDPKINAQWNYLGSGQDKEKYLDYLENTFWTLQSEPMVQKSPILNQMTEKTWLISKVLPTINNLDYRHPQDFFSKESEEFNLKIDSIFSKIWQPNLDLIINPEGSFQFKIECKNHDIAGFIKKENDDLILKIEVNIF